MNKSSEHLYFDILTSCAWLQHFVGPLKNFEYLWAELYHVSLFSQNGDLTGEMHDMPIFHQNEWTISQTALL